MLRALQGANTADAPIMISLLSLGVGLIAALLIGALCGILIGYLESCFSCYFRNWNSFEWHKYSVNERLYPFRLSRIYTQYWKWLAFWNTNSIYIIYDFSLLLNFCYLGLLLVLIFISSAPIQSQQIF